MLRLALFLSVVSAVLLVAIIYVVRRTFTVLGIERGRAVPRRLVIGGLFLALLLPWLSRFHSVMHMPISERLSAFGYVVGLAVVFSAALMVPIDLVRWVTPRGRQAKGAEAGTATAAGADPPESGTGTGTGPESGTGTDPESGAGTVPDADADPESGTGTVPNAGAGPESGTGTGTGPGSGADASLGRRSFLTRAAYGTALATGVGHSVYAFARGRHDYVIEEVVVRIRDLPPQLEGLTIAQISDIHVGTFVGERELRSGLELIERARPDLIALTGDLIDHDPSRAPTLGRFTRQLTELNPRFGVVGIPGNHDYYTDVETVLSTLRESGVTVLRNSAIELRDGDARLGLLGTDDLWAERDNWGTRYDLPATLAAAPRDCPRILLCHNPDAFEEAAPHVDLQLSGHTHGGQVNFVVRPIDLVGHHPFVAGHYTRGDGQLYVNRGFGTVGPPARLYAPPEITKIVLTRA